MTSNPTAMRNMEVEGAALAPRAQSAMELCQEALKESPIDRTHVPVDVNALRLALYVIETMQPIVDRYCGGIASGNWKVLGEAYFRLHQRE